MSRERRQRAKKGNNRSAPNGKLRKNTTRDYETVLASLYKSEDGRGRER